MRESMYYHLSTPLKTYEDTVNKKNHCVYEVQSMYSVYAMGDS